METIGYIMLALPILVVTGGLLYFVFKEFGWRRTSQIAGICGLVFAYYATASFFLGHSQ